MRAPDECKMMVSIEIVTRKLERIIRQRDSLPANVRHELAVELYNLSRLLEKPSLERQHECLIAYLCSMLDIFMPAIPAESAKPSKPS
jgi:hypothetical protein